MSLFDMSSSSSLVSRVSVSGTCSGRCQKPGKAPTPRSNGSRRVQAARLVDLVGREVEDSQAAQRNVPYFCWEAHQGSLQKQHNAGGHEMPSNGILYWPLQTGLQAHAVPAALLAPQGSEEPTGLPGLYYQRPEHLMTHVGRGDLMRCRAGLMHMEGSKCRQGARSDLKCPDVAG